jgi:hypothetical protein
MHLAPRRPLSPAERNNYNPKTFPRNTTNWNLRARLAPRTFDA